MSSDSSVSQANESNTILTTERIDELIAVYRDGLLNDTLPFWIDRCVDREIPKASVLPEARGVPHGLPQRRETFG